MRSSVETQSRAAVNRSSADRSLTLPLQAAVFGAGLPLASDVNAALANNPTVTGAFPSGSQIFELGVAGIRHPPSGGSINTDVRSTLRVDVSLLAAPAQLKIGFLDPLVTGNGFNSLRLRIFRQVAPSNLLSTVLDQTFNAVDLVGHPISISQFVEDVQQGGLVFSSRALTYTPYFRIGDISEPEATNDDIITGTPLRRHQASTRI